MTAILSNPLVPLFVLAGVSVILLSAVFMLSRKVRKLLRGKSAATLEDTIVSLGSEIDALQKFELQSEKYFENIEARIRRSIQAVETIRFNPWKGSGEGGNQSFATALLNEHGDGVVLSSLYSRERVSVFSKPIKKHASEFELSAEEIEALDRSKKSVAAGSSLHL